MFARFESLSMLAVSLKFSRSHEIAFATWLPAESDVFIPRRCFPNGPINRRRWISLAITGDKISTSFGFSESLQRRKNASSSSASIFAAPAPLQPASSFEIKDGFSEMSREMRCLSKSIAMDKTAFPEWPRPHSFARACRQWPRGIRFRSGKTFPRRQ